MPGPSAALVYLRLSALGSVREEPPPGSPPGGEVLPGQQPRTDHSGEGHGSQEGEEAQVEQALDAIVADASEGIQVVLEERDMQLEGSGAQPQV